jgi:hypothetical protein
VGYELFTCISSPGFDVLGSLWEFDHTGRGRMAVENEVGANPTQAVSRGSAAEDHALTFSDLTEDFARLLERTMEDAKEPLCQEGYPDFRDLARPRMREVQEHGTALAGNVQAGGARAGATDTDSAAGYDDSTGGWELSEGVFTRPINTIPYAGGDRAGYGPV